MSLDDLEPSDLNRPAVGQEHEHDTGDAPRRRRRRGGRGRGGRGRGEGFTDAPRSGAPLSGSAYDGPIETMSLADLDGGVPGGVPEYMRSERRGSAQPSGASRRALGSGPSRIADEVARSQRDGSSRSNMSAGMESESVPSDVAALLRSQLEATGRSADSAPALSGKDAPTGGRTRAKAKPAAKKPAAKKPAAKKPAAKVALVKKPAARPKSKR